MSTIQINDLAEISGLYATTAFPVENVDNITTKITAANIKIFMSNLANLTVQGNAITNNQRVNNRLIASSAAITSLSTGTTSVSGVLTSTVATGTAPLSITSTTLVPNLYVSRAVVADSATGGLTTTSILSGTGDATITGTYNTLDITLETVNSNVGTYGSATKSAQITVDEKGRITSVTEQDIAFPDQTILANTAEITANVSTGNPGLNLAPSGVTAGTYGGAVTVPQITVDSKGRVTNVTSIAVNSTLNTINIGVPVGTIAIWSGPTESIPAGWHIADGTNGTLDLRGKFVLGASSTYAKGSTGGFADTVVPWHTHTATSTSTFTGSQMPSHVHTVTDPGHTHAGSGSGTVTITDPGHTHYPQRPTSGYWTGVPAMVGQMPDGWSWAGGSRSPDGDIDGSTSVTGYDKASVALVLDTVKTGITATVNVTTSTQTSKSGISIDGASAGTPSGTVTTATTINNAGSQTPGTNLPPYTALYYIQKIDDSVSINNPINYLATLGNITAGGNLIASAGTPSTSTTTGALVVTGGAGIAGTVNIGGALNITGSTTGITKSMVGLSNVDNTSDANKPVSTATASALSLKADNNSPTFTGTPLAPTAASGTSTTQIATTAFVQTAISSYTGLSIYAPKASPALTGIPTAPTAPAGTSTTQIATTAFTQNAVRSLTSVMRVTRGSATSVSTSTGSLTNPLKFPYDTITFDADNAWDANGKRVQPRIAGTYRVHATIGYTATGVNGFTTCIQLNKNGIKYARNFNLVNYGAGYHETLELDDLVYFDGLTDYVEILWGTNSSTLNATAGASYDTSSTLTIELVKPA